MKRKVKMNKTYIISKLLGAIIFISFGVFLVVYGIQLHNDVFENYDCKFCSILEDECPEGYDSEENFKCLDRLVIPFKFSGLMPSMGVIVIGMAIVSLVPKEFFNVNSIKREEKQNE